MSTQTIDIQTTEGSEQKYPYKMSFNQDNTCLSIGTEKGYRLYNLSRIPNNLDLLYKEETETTAKTENINRLFTSSLLAYSSQNEPNKIYLAHFRKNQIICDYTYPSPVRNILLNRNRLVIVLDDEIYIHAIKDMSLIHIIKDFSPILSDNVNCVSLASPMSASALSNLIAYPIINASISDLHHTTNLNEEAEAGETRPKEASTSNGATYKNASTAQGQIAIFDAYLLRTIKIIDAHENKIQSTCFANNSSFRAGSCDNPLLLATASEKGTVIRIWSIPQGQCIKELRRGMYHADIQQLTFSLDAKYLGLISKNSTVHVWNVNLGNKSFAEAINSNFNPETENSNTHPNSNNTLAQNQQINDDNLEKLQQEDEQKYQNPDNSWYSYLTGLMTSYLDATYNLTTGGVINRAHFNCKIPTSQTAQSLAILQNHIILTTQQNQVLIYNFDSKIKNEIQMNENSNEDPENPYVLSLECEILKNFEIELDDQEAVLVHRNSRIKSVTDESNGKKGSSYANKSKKKMTGSVSKPMTRNTSKQIELDLRNGH